MPTDVLFTWSSGKDSALALARLLRSPEHRVTGLLTTVTEGYDRVSMHGVRRQLLEQQAERLGLPLSLVTIPQQADNDIYETRMRAELLRHREAGVTTVAFGDIFLADLRRYREEKLASVELEAVFPLWQQDTTALADELISQGYEVTITCVDSQAFADTGKSAEAFAGRRFDRQFLADLPASVDPCGENGEFHTFVSAAPIFRASISVTVGGKLLRDERFWFCDVVPS
ncbi:MAG: ATP-binding protein [Gemmatimonadota bacterium]